TATTAGVTPAVARQFHLPATPTAQHVAPGPAIHGAPLPVAATASTVAIGRPGLPPLHNPAQATPAAAAVHPLPAMPALRPPPGPGQVGPPAIQHGAGAISQGVTHPMPVLNPNAAAPATITHVPPTPGGIERTAPLTTPPPPVGSHLPPP